MTDAPFVTNDGTLTEQPEDELWVRSGDNVQALADDIDATMEGRGYVNLACIGAGAVNQAVKAVAVAREIAAEHAYALFIQPYFSNIVDDQERKRTRMMLRVTAENR